MATITKHFNLSFPQQLINEPLLYNISTKFDMKFNISRANVTDAHGHLTISLAGDPEQIKQALHYLQQRGVVIEEIPAPQPATR